MLETLKPKSKWVWSAWGKHPLAKDYIQLGTLTSLGKAFAGWIAKGYKRLSTDSGEPPPACAWRFWAKGDGRSTIVCGTIQTSSDGIGRPFPLLLMGNGSINGWQKHWHLLPAGLDSTWRRLEHLTSYQGKSIQSFEEALVTLAIPQPAWRELGERFASGLLTNESAAQLKPVNREKLLAGFVNQQMIWEKLEEQGDANLLAQSVMIHDLIKRQTAAIPSLVFMGGVPGAAYLAFFQRSLRSADFVRLWRPTNSFTK